MMERLTSPLAAITPNELALEMLDSHTRTPSADFLAIEPAFFQQGFRYLLLFLREAMLFKNTKIFYDNVFWFLQTQAANPLAQQLVSEMLSKLKQSIRKKETEFTANIAQQMIDTVLSDITKKQATPSSYLLQPGIDQQNSHAYLQALLDLDTEKARAIIDDQYGKCPDIIKIYQSIFQPAQYEIGRLWQTGVISVATEHFCTEITRQLITELMSLIKTSPRHPSLLGLCAPSEQHSLGLQIVCDHFKLAGWNSLYLGTGLPPDGIADLLPRQDISVIGISVTVPYHVHEAAAMIETIRRAADRPVYIIVGGLAFNTYPDLYKKVGADAHAHTAAKAVQLASMAIKSNVNRPDFSH